MITFIKGLLHALPGICSVLAIIAHTPTLAQTNTYPDRAVRIIVPFAAGATLDLMTRAVGQALSTVIKQPVIIENKAGASGIIGAEATVKADPDGYTFMMAPFSVLAVNPSLHPHLPYDPLTDFVPVSHVADAPHILIASAALPIKTLDQLKSYIQDNPGKVSYASAGAGSSAHLATEVMNYQYGITMTHVPYKGTAPAYNDLIPGRVAVMIDGAAAVLPRIQSGLVVPLGVTSAKRIHILPDVPTLAEAGIKGYEVNPWYGLVAPKETPPERVMVINNAIKTALNTDDLKKKFSEMGLDAVGDDPQAFGAFMKSEVAKWKKVVQDAHVKAD
jgi:tripartite-type tricarboxylate transporter receptor subunit TctC